MVVGVPNFNGRRLIQARLARGLRKNELGEKIGVSSTAIARYEDGLDRPRWERLHLLSGALEFPLEFFLQPSRLDFDSAVFWRHQNSETKAAREMTEQRMIWLCELYKVLEEEVNFPMLSLPWLAIPKDIHLITDDIIENAADDLRRWWRLSDQPIPDVTLALENAGIPVIYLDIVSDKQDGFGFWMPNRSRFFVGINSRNVSFSRSRFDLAHELGHLVLHGHLNRTEVEQMHDLIERQAHRFAGAFLFPRSSFVREIILPTLDYMVALKRRWGMSVAAMIYRCHDLNLINEDERRALYRNLNRRGWRKPLGEPFDDRKEIPLERPRMLRRAVELLMREGTMGQLGVRSILQIPVGELEQLLGIDSGALQERSYRFQSSANQALQAKDFETGTVIEFPVRGRP